MFRMRRRFPYNLLVIKLNAAEDQKNLYVHLYNKEIWEGIYHTNSKVRETNNIYELKFEFVIPM